MFLFGGLSLNAGDRIMRRDLHEQVGGQTQSGISPSSRFPTVMLFSNPSAGDQYGYFDGVQADGFFHYSGEGQRGDQEMKRGNKRIRDHVGDGRELHLFLGEGKGQPVTYAGRYHYLDHYDTDAPELGGSGVLRKVIMFRLQGAGSTEPASVPASPLTRPTTTAVVDVATEQHLTERYFLDPARETTEAERREAALVKDFERQAVKQGNRLSRKRITVAGELKPLFCDLFDPAAHELIEAKGTTTREAIRMAIGQLYDYRRFVQPTPRLALLLPERPREDLLKLLATCSVTAIYRTPDGFERTDGN